MAKIDKNNLKSTKEKLLYAREYYQKNKEKWQEYSRTRQALRRTNPEIRKKMYEGAVASKRKARLEVINHYGGKCACCGESRYEFLAIDHINGGGTALRRTKKQSSDQIVWEIRREGFPNIYRVLCHNCNQALGVYGYCPHNKDFK